MGPSKDQFPTFFVNFNYPWKLKRFFLPKSLRNEAKIEIVYGVNLARAYGVTIYGKTRVQKSHATVPLRNFPLTNMTLDMCMI
jgi:hypothetical protein